MTEPAVLWTISAQGVASVILNRPDRNNAYNGEMIAGLHAALDALGGAPQVRAVVITGNGRHFQAGADLDWLESVRSEDAVHNYEVSRLTASAVDRLNRVPVPTLVTVQGACIGGGTGLVSACDIVIAAENSRFAISEVRWGLEPSIIVPQLIDAIGLRHVRRYALTSEQFSAAEALRIGLIHEIVPEERLAARADEIVSQILSNAPRAVASTKAHILDHSAGARPELDLEALTRSHAARRQAAEAGEGIASFREKRAARWSTPG